MASLQCVAMAPDGGVEEEGPPMPDIHALQLQSKDSGNVPASALDATDTAVEATPVPPHLSHDPATNAKRTDPFQFGQRFLTEKDDVFEYNAWDHVEPDSDHEAFCESQYARQRAAPVTDFDKSRFNDKPEKWWDLFYKQKTSTFFKDRKWLVQEFPILKDVTSKDAGKKVVLEVGAGAGNTAFPIVRMNENEELSVIAVDFSKKAVETMRSVEDYHDGEGIMRAEVWDAAGEALPEGLGEGTVDVVIMIFIFSALNPRQWAQAVRNIHRVLKPGGEVLFRDYGRGDLAQVRFKAGRWMEENFYVRGDGTRVYFFEKEQLEYIWSGQHADGTSSEHLKHGGTEKTRPLFETVNLDVDRRLIVNRQKRVKMYRCWIQGRFRKCNTG